MIKIYEAGLTVIGEDAVDLFCSYFNWFIEGTLKARAELITTFSRPESSPMMWEMSRMTMHKLENGSLR
ncbi:hypothetical protein J3R83DRAFT_10209 [Lanmaoa asiatica]|nr:hypothetical protein J3R83DRAFT_10209 [Lanmaoa asiatica]